MHIVLDFDGVIRDTQTNEPIEGAEKGILQFKEDGHKVTILTANTVPFVQEWIFNNMKKVTRASAIEKVTNTKPVADVYVDDKGVRFSGWGNLKSSLIP